MTQLAESLRSFTDAYGAQIASHVWISTLFLLLVLVVILALRDRLTARARFALSFIGILKFAIPGAIAAPLVDGLRYRLFSDTATAPVAFPLQFLGGTLSVQTNDTPRGSWQLVAFGVWLLVAILLILRFAITRHRLITLAVRTALPPEPREIDALHRARRRLGLRRSIDIARSGLPESPAVLRIMRPLIVLPATGCDELSDDELESLLRHECAHVARHDNLLARIESFICALFWFHPLIWIAQRITVIERERACDEVVSESADERETYLGALRKFCHAAIAPRLPGVSCMATARLKERMDHVMKYETIRAQAPSTNRLTLLATAALALFTLASAIVGSSDAMAAATGDDARYTMDFKVTRSGELITLTGSVRDKTTGRVIAAPRMKFEPGRSATSTTSAPEGLEVTFDVVPAGAEWLTITGSVKRDGSTVETFTSRVAPSAETYSGDPITLRLENADIRDVIKTFGKVTGMNIEIDEDVSGAVTIDWRNVPWDEAFDSLMKENELTYRIEGSTVRVTRK